MTDPDQRLTAALQEIANLAAQHAVEAFQLRQRIVELESRVAEIQKKGDAA